MIKQALGICAAVALLAPAIAEATPVNGLKNIPVQGTGSNGAAFTGTLSITQVAFDASNQLVASGVLRGGFGGRQFVQSFSNVPFNLSESGGTLVPLQVTAPSCPILFLDIGPIFLDVLGLQVSLSEIVLDISAAPGPGNLLGNLLCAVAGLLDNFTLDALLQNILQSLLNILNGLLAP